MEYEDFVKAYTEELKDYLYCDNGEIVRHTVEKVNGELDAISIKYQDTPLAPTFYLPDKYEMYQEGYSVQQIAEITADQLAGIKDTAPQVPDFTRDDACQHLYSSVINENKNKALLNGVPHEKFNDLAIVARYRIDETSSFIVTNELCSYMKMTGDEVIEAAKSNTEREQFNCSNINEAVRKIMLDDGIPEEYVDDLIEVQGRSCPMYVMTNSSGVDGAVCITVPGAMETAYNKVKESYPDMGNMYVMCGSRHELLLVPDSTVVDVEDLRMIHLEVQAKEVSSEEQLSDSIYEYDAETKRITVSEVPTLEAENTKALVETASVGRAY